MSLRDHSIDSAYSFFDELFIDYAIGSFQRENLSEPIAQSRPSRDASVNEKLSMRRQVGSAMMRTGGLILMVSPPRS